MMVIYGKADCEKTKALVAKHQDAIFMDLFASNITPDFALKIGMCDAMAEWCLSGEPSVTEVEI